MGPVRSTLKTCVREHRVFLVIVFVFLVTRLWNIDRLDVVHDECMYLSWTGAIADDWGRAFLPQIDGKTPLYYWIAALWPGLWDNPLVACRQVSAFSGLAAVAAVYALGRRFFDKRTGLLAAFLYTFSPYPLFLERMALVDALLSAIGLWTLWSVLSLLRLAIPFRKGALLTALLAAAGYLTKPPALLWGVSIAAVALILARDPKTPLSFRKRALVVAASAAGLVGGILLCLSADLDGVYSKRDRIFVHTPFQGHYWMTVKEILGLPFATWGDNAVRIASYLAAYLPWTFWVPLTVGCIGSGLAGGAIGLWFAVPALVVGVVLNDPHSRFLLFAAAPLVILAARGIAMLSWRFPVGAGTLEVPSKAAWFLSAFVSIPGIVFAWDLATEPHRAGWIEQDRTEYITGELAGNGLGEAVAFIEKEAQEGPLDLFVYHLWGVPSDLAQAHFRHSPSVRVWMVHWGDRILDGHPPQMHVVRNQYTHEMSPLDFTRIRRAYLLIRHDYAREENLRRLNPGAERLRGFGLTPDGIEKFVLWKLR